jgi:hypothetical protein
MPVMALLLCLSSHAHLLSRVRSWAASRVRHAASGPGSPLDAGADAAYVASWRASLEDDAATCLFSAPSQAEPSMSLQVVQRGDGWRTMRLVGRRRTILHGQAKFDALGNVEPSAVPTEYIKSLAALGLAGLSHASPRCLFLGLGAGTLPRLLAAHAPGARPTAVEYDATVCEAAATHMGIDGSRVDLITSDAATWVAARARDRSPVRYDAAFVDVFDEANDCPPAFTSEAFLIDLAALLAPDGVVVHNLHHGSRALNASLARAETAYERVFASGVCVQSLDSRPWAGNTIIAASGSRDAYGGAIPELMARARCAGVRHDLLFDAAARCEGARHLCKTPPWPPPDPGCDS